MIDGDGISLTALLVVTLVDVAVVVVDVVVLSEAAAEPSDFEGDRFVLELDVDKFEDTATSSDPNRIDELAASGTSWMMARGASCAATTGCCDRSQRVNGTDSATSKVLACRFK